MVSVTHIKSRGIFPSACFLYAKNRFIEKWFLFFEKDQCMVANYETSIRKNQTTDRAETVLSLDAEAKRPWL